MTDDPVELIIKEALDEMGITYTHGPLDFELAGGIGIECKRMYSDRIVRQIKDRKNVIVVQGIEAAALLANFIRGGKASRKKVKCSICDEIITEDLND